MILTREQIKAAREDATAVAVPEWGEGAEVLVRKPRLKVALSLMGDFGGVMTPETIAAAVVASVVDEAGAQVFTVADIEWLIAEKSAAVLMRIANHALGVAVQVAGPSEQAEKNSDPSLQ